MKNNAIAFEFQPFSRKQKKLLTWWMPESPFCDYDMIIADGSIRAGKTVAMIDSFVMWTLHTFTGQNFIIAGKSMGALKRNVIEPLQKILAAKGIAYRYVRSSESPHVQIGTNVYYLFGANNEKSQDTLQGLTAAGALADEVALMPKSFVDQMIGRCSVDGSKVWMNCNPAGPYHHIKTEYIDKAKEKQILHLHFTLDDNPSLSEKVKQRYRRMFTGVFFKRYILGLWVMAEGIIYDAYSDDMTVDKLPEMKRTWVGVDYGTSNATTFILCGLGTDDRLYVIDEYYHSGRESGRQKSPSQYSKDFREWYSKLYSSIGARYKPEYIYIDPSAEAFIVQLWYDDRSLPIASADNEVKGGIERVSSIMTADRFRVHSSCKNVLRELSSYVWDEKASIDRGEDKPVKQNDHTLDPIRYVANGGKKLWDKLLKELAA